MFYDFLYSVFVVFNLLHVQGFGHLMGFYFTCIDLALIHTQLNQDWADVFCYIFMCCLLFVVSFIRCCLSCILIKALLSSDPRCPVVYLFIL